MKQNREVVSMNKEEIKRISQQLDTQLALTLRFMDESPVFQRISKMSAEGIEGLPDSERGKLAEDVLGVIEDAKRKARMLTGEIL